MDNKKFIFHTTKTGEQSAFSLKYIPSIVTLVWAAIIIFNFAKNGHIFPIILFIVVFFTVMGFVWSVIWNPWLEFNQEKKEIQTKLPFSIWAINKADLERMISVKKTDLHQEIKQTIQGCIGGIIGGAIGGLILGLVIGLIFVGIKLGIFGGVLLGALAGLGGAFVQPGNYVTYALKFKDKGDEKKEEKSSETKTEDSSVEEMKTSEYVVYIENKEDIELFEKFLLDCLATSGRNDILIENS